MLIIATIDLPEGVGAITLRTGASKKYPFFWDGPRRLESISRLATEISNPPYYTHSVADGTPGVLAAQKVQEVLGGELKIVIQTTGRGDGIDGDDLPDELRQQDLERETPQPPAPVPATPEQDLMPAPPAALPTTINVSMPTPVVNIAPPQIVNQITMPPITLPTPPEQKTQEPPVVNVTVQPSPVVPVTVPAPEVRVTVEAPTVTVPAQQPPTVNVAMPELVIPPQPPAQIVVNPTPVNVNVQPPNITVEAPNVSVESPVEVTVQPAEIKEVNVEVTAKVEQEKVKPKDKVVRIEKTGDGQWTGKVEER